MLDVGLRWALGSDLSVVQAVEGRLSPELLHQTRGLLLALLAQS